MEDYQVIQPSLQPAKIDNKKLESINRRTAYWSCKGYSPLVCAETHTDTVALIFKSLI